MMSTSVARYSFVGTPYWMAPEVIRKDSVYGYKADIWSFGITIYELLMGNPPHAELDPKAVLQTIPHARPVELEPALFRVETRDFVQACLIVDPDERPSAEELLKKKLVAKAPKHGESLMKELITIYDAWKKVNATSDDENDLPKTLYVFYLFCLYRN